MENPKNIKIADYAYDLPDSRIAKYPLQERDTSKLLIYDHGNISHKSFRDLPTLLPQGSLMVMNNTRVIQARLHFRKAALEGATGALIEVFCLEPAVPNDYVLMFQQTRSCVWHCLVGNSKKWKTGELQQTIVVGGNSLTLTALRLNGEEAAEAGLDCKEGESIVRFAWDNDTTTWADILDACGELPIPPYLNRATEENDLKTYQTVYSKVKGSVAAPTAGLHFTPAVLSKLDEQGIERTELTLHVGAGTFKPVKSQLIEGHTMHSEWIYVPRTAIEALLRHNGECTAVGTTSVRTLESLYYIGKKLMANPNATEDQLMVAQWEPYEDTDSQQPSTMQCLSAIKQWMQQRRLSALHTATQIIIAPGYNYHIVKRMITNFHQPQSTLLLLVSAFVGDQKWKHIYNYALQNDFRFLSYGDSSLLIP